MIKEQNKKLYDPHWKQISEATILAIGETCQVCGKKRDRENKKNGWLTVHHKDRNPANNKPENLLVVCPRCHFGQERLINKNYFNKHQTEFNFITEGTYGKIHQ